MHSGRAGRLGSLTPASACFCPRGPVGPLLSALPGLPYPPRCRVLTAVFTLLSKVLMPFVGPPDSATCAPGRLPTPYRFYLCSLMWSGFKCFPRCLRMCGCEGINIILLTMKCAQIMCWERTPPTTCRFGAFSSHFKLALISDLRDAEHKFHQGQVTRVDPKENR